MPTAAFDVETQRQESLSCREGNLSKGDSKGEGAVKAEAVLRARQSHSSVVVLQVQVHTLHLSCRCLVSKS